MIRTKITRCLSVLQHSKTLFANSVTAKLFPVFVEKQKFIRLHIGYINAGINCIRGCLEAEVFCV